MHQLKLHRSFRAAAVPALFLGILSYSFALSFYCGERGFFPLDQSIMFDGAYRIVSGQVPFRDFVLPVGPGVFAIQALIFKVCGVSYWSYLIGAAAINVLAAAASMFILWTLFPGNRLLMLVAGVVTGTWFYPPYGTPNMEQTAFLFGMLGIAACLRVAAQNVSGRLSQAALPFFAGCCIVLSFLSKQNAGVLIAPVLPCLLFAGFGFEWRRLAMALIWLTAGVVVAACSFVFWLYVYSDPQRFLYHFFTIPSREGASRMANVAEQLVPSIVGGNYKDAVSKTMLGSIVVGACFAWKSGLHRWREQESRRLAMLAAAMCVLLPLYQIGFYCVTNNQWTECLPFVGVVIASAIGLVFRTADSHSGCDPTPFSRGLSGLTVPCSLLVAGLAASLLRRDFSPAITSVVVISMAYAARLMQASPAGGDSPADGNALRGVPSIVRRRIVTGLIAAVVVVCVGQGIFVSWTRHVHDIFRESTFPSYSTIPKLEYLKWGVTTGYRGVEFSEGDLATLIERLRSDNEPFFVFSDFTILYGIVGIPAPQPLLWFHHGLTYPIAYDESLDRGMVESLIRREVRTVVIEQVCWWGTNQLANFPLLESFIGNEFDEDATIGPFTVMRRKAERDSSANGLH